jgi:hypothetical protein
MTSQLLLALHKFAQSVPNCHRYTIVWSLDDLTVWFDGVHSKRFSIKKVLGL